MARILRRQRQSCAKTPVSCVRSTAHLWYRSGDVPCPSVDPLRSLSESSVLDVLLVLRARLGSNPCAGPHVGVDGAAPVLCAAPIRLPADTKGGLARLGSPSNKLSTPSPFPSNSGNAASHTIKRPKASEHD